MRKRIFLYCLCGLLILAGALTKAGRFNSLLAKTISKKRVKPSSKPNVVFILTDDQDLDSIEQMPHLKSLLMERGTTFSNFFVDDSLCCPSRSSILRGQYAHNHHVLTNSPPEGGFEKFYSQKLENSTVATWLHSTGYKTIFLGKYLNGYPHDAPPTYVPAGWDEWHSPVCGTPYNEYGYQLNENGQIIGYGQLPKDYMTDVLAEKATQLISKSAQESQPFFMYLATYAPHKPETPAVRHQDLFSHAKVPHRNSFNEADVSDKPEYIRNLPPLNEDQLEHIDKVYRKRLQSLQAVDEMIEKVVKALELAGRLENTYIFFASDNGLHLGQHRLPPGKGTPYEEDIRVPLIVRGPGIAAGRVIEQFSLNIDLSPTFAELAGAKLPDFVDGRSLVSVLKNPNQTEGRQAFLVEFWPKIVQARRKLREGQLLETDSKDQPQIHFKLDGTLEPADAKSPLPPEYQAIRTKDYLYVEYVTGERELYDLHVDPYEEQNIVSKASPELIQELASRLDALRKCTGPGCHRVEDAPLHFQLKK